MSSAKPKVADQRCKEEKKEKDRIGVQERDTVMCDMLFWSVLATGNNLHATHPTPGRILHIPAHPLGMLLLLLDPPPPRAPWYACFSPIHTPLQRPSGGVETGASLLAPAAGPAAVVVHGLITAHAMPSWTLYHNQLVCLHSDALPPRSVERSSRKRIKCRMGVSTDQGAVLFALFRSGRFSSLGGRSLHEFTRSTVRYAILFPYPPIEPLGEAKTLWR